METLFDQSDAWSLLFPALILLYIGQHCVKSAPSAEIWGKRIASAMFLLVVGIELLSGEFSDPFAFASATISALVMSGLVLGLCWTFLPFPLFLLQQTVGGGMGKFQRWNCDRQRRRTEKEQAREAREQERRRAEAWKQNAPERKRQQQAEERRKKNQADQQRRREEVRLRCQLLYDQHATELRDKLALERLEAYFQQYLSDEHTAEMVEQRGELLREMIEQSLGTELSRQSEFSSLEQIAVYFKERRTEIERLEYDVITLQTIQASLSAQEEASIRAFLSHRR